MASPEPAHHLPPGFSFAPHDSEVVSSYLRWMIAGQPLPDAAARFLHRADVYGDDPATLAAGFLAAVSMTPAGEPKDCWYFFGCAKPKSTRGKRKSRTVGGDQGTWHAETARKDVLDGQGRVVGYKQTFSYKPKNADGSEAVWLMVEFCADQEQEDDESRRGEPVPILCKIYPSPRRPGSSSYRSALKRKAADERPHVAGSSPVRRRLLFAPDTLPPPPATVPPLLVEPQPIWPQPELYDQKLPETPAFLDGISVEFLQDFLASGHMSDQVLGDFFMPVQEPEPAPQGPISGEFLQDYLASGHMSDQVLGDFFMPVQEPEPAPQGPMSALNFSFRNAGSAVSSYDTVLLGGGGGSGIPPCAPFAQSSDQFLGDFFVPQPAELQGQTATLNCSFPPPACIC